MISLVLLLSFGLLCPSAGRKLYNTTSSSVRGVVNVFLLSHSHDDVGWVKSPHEYFLGSRVIGLDPGGSAPFSLYYANGAVQFILTSVVDALSANPDRRFVVVEQWFFQRWWDGQEDSVQERVRGLVASRQLIFANGGLVMHDEACPTFQDMVDQTAAGVRWLAATFGPSALPRVTSQLDPFGHAAVQAAMLASPMSGYVAQFHARMDYQEGSLRHATQTLDFAWAPSTSLGLSALTLGSLGNTGYSAPDGFCFDVGIECQAESAAVYSGTGLNNPINDEGFRGLPDAVDDNVLTFMAQVQKTVADMKGSYPMDADGTVFIPWTMGDDFDYGAAQMNFGSLDKLIHYTNLNTSQHGINMFYSTQADYASARLGQEAPLSLKTSDAFPYSSGPHSVWSGYYTSRPALKGYVRATSGLFAAARLLQAWAAPPTDVGHSNPLWLLESGLGVAQHHDAVSGTSKQVVADDYARRLAAGRSAAQGAMGGWVNTLLGLQAAAAAGGIPPPHHSSNTHNTPHNATAVPPPLAWAPCDLANATLCPSIDAAGSTGTPLALLLLNSQSQGVGQHMRLPVAGAASWRVLASDGTTEVTAQLVPFSPSDLALREYYGAPAPSPTAAWLCFITPPLPPAGMAVMFLVPVSDPTGAPSTHPSTPLPTTTTTNITNGVVTLTFDGDTGLLVGFASKDSAASLPQVALTQEVLVYNSSVGDGASGQASGAYIFRPSASGGGNASGGGGAATPVRPPGGGSVAQGGFTGPVLSEVWQGFAPWAWQRTVVWGDDRGGFEVASTLGPLPVREGVLEGGVGLEVVSRFTAGGWATGGVWDSDGNGREWQHRARNARPDYNLSLTEATAQNYYPVTTAIRMQEGGGGGSGGGALTVLTDRTQGGASLADGSLELMVHRRLTRDDGLGVLEALNERGLDGKGLRVGMEHRVLVTPVGAPAAKAHRAALAGVLLPTQWMVAPLPSGVGSPGAWVASLPHPPATNASLLTPGALPSNVQLLTLHSWNTSSALLRLGHAFEVGEEGRVVASQANATLALAGLFAPPTLHIVAAVEMTLTGSQPLADVEPVTYRVAGVGNITLPVVPPAPAGADLVVGLSPMQVRTFLVTFGA